MNKAVTMIIVKRMYINERSAIVMILTMILLTWYRVQRNENEL